MLRALIGTALVGGTLFAAGAGGPSMALTGAKPSQGPATLTMQSAPTFGGALTLSATYAPMKWTAQESVSCSQGGSQVYLAVQTAPSAAQPWVSTFTMWSQTWVNAGSGPATCTAQLYYYTWQGKTETSLVLLSTTTFSTS